MSPLLRWCACTVAIGPLLLAPWLIAPGDFLGATLLWLVSVCGIVPLSFGDRWIARWKGRR